MQKTVYNDNEKQFYKPRIDYKTEKDGMIRKEQLPVDSRTGKMANVILTIESVRQRVNTYINPKNKQSSEKTQYVLYFKEKYFYTIPKGSGTQQEIWSLPLALNITNARMLLHTTGHIDEKKLIGCKVEIKYDDTVTIGKEVTGGIRVVNVIASKITQEQVLELQNLCKNAGKTEIDICNAYKVSYLHDIPAEKFEAMKQRLTEIAQEKHIQEKQENK